MSLSPVFLGIDGGGTKTAFTLINAQGQVLARHQAATSYYLEIGFERLGARLHAGVQEVLSMAGLAPADVHFAFAGLPAHGEDSRLLSAFDALLGTRLPHCKVGNDMVCSWAGSLAGGDGVSLVAGTGSIAYGEWQGRTARCGGWGEVFGDEGSAHWLAREALTLFSRMADGRRPPGPLLDLMRQHFDLKHDLDLCAAINGGAERSRLAQLARLVTQAAEAGDAQAQHLLARAGEELAELAMGTAAALQVPSGARLPVSYSGGVFAAGESVLAPLRSALEGGLPGTVLTPPRFGPELGAALHAARLAGRPLDTQAMERLTDCGSPAIA